MRYNHSKEPDQVQTNKEKGGEISHALKKQKHRVLIGDLLLISI